MYGSWRGGISSGGICMIGENGWGSVINFRIEINFNQLWKNNTEHFESSLMWIGFEKRFENKSVF